MNYRLKTKYSVVCGGGTTTHFFGNYPMTEQESSTYIFEIISLRF